MAQLAPHATISPAILYWGTPVVLITSTNPDGSTNIAPMSSAWWLGQHCMLGLDALGHTPYNILRTGQCVLNLPDDSASLLAAVNALALVTGAPIVPPSKLARGYAHVADKWTHSGLTPQPSETVEPLRVLECPVQMECELVAKHELFGGGEGAPAMALEVVIRRVHVHEELRMDGFANRVSPDRWRPMIMSFQELYGLRDGRLGESALGRIDQESFRG